MSASLVGSEMCIRDSIPPARPPDSGLAPAAQLCSQGAVTQRCCRSCAAVSYTHLTLPTICSV
eukprot:12510409-Alexandrium_andersonii.AAC.1